MSDLISRQAAIDAIEQKAYRHTYIEQIVDIINGLPSAQFEERKESLCKKVRALCEESKIEFFFVGEGESTWSVTNDKHIKKIVECHKAQLSQEGTTKDATSDTISRQAVKHLDIFTKTYCRDKSVKDDLVFRCNQCDFQLPDGTCLVKTMARKLCPDYREFGSMGDL